MLVFVMRFSYNPDDTFSKVFLLIVTLMMLVLVRSFSYTPDANVNEFVLQSSC